MLFFVSTCFFLLNLRKQFSPKPWKKIKVSTIVKHFYGMLIKNWQGQKSWGQILKHLFSFKSQWIQCECYFIEDFNPRSFTWTRTLAFWLLIIPWLACIQWNKLNTTLSPKLCSGNLSSNILCSLWDQNSSSHQRKCCTWIAAKYQSLDSQDGFQRSVFPLTLKTYKSFCVWI